MKMSPVTGRFVSQYSKEYWSTADGRTYQLAFMNTSHLFFAFRMLYDRVALIQGWPLMRPLGQGRKASSKLTEAELARSMACLATDIIARNDLDPEWRQPFADMLARILAVESMASAYVTKLLE